jgi:predicted lysophospholipase L1 biosynthesis ABC-type transport system permease subunit
MVRTWVPEPVPALVSGDEHEQFDGPGLQNNIHLTVAGRLPRVPGAGPNARVVDLDGLVRRGDTAVVNDGVAVWSDDASALAKVKVALRARGVLVGRVRTVDDVRAQLDASPAAWSLALSVLVGGAALLVAMLVMVVATATTWRARATDLAALRMAGLPSRALRRLELLGQLPVVLVGGAAGSVCGTVAAVLALPGVRQFTDPPAVDTTVFATPWAAVLGAAVLGLALLALLAVVSSRWTARRAPLNRIREVV